MIYTALKGKIYRIPTRRTNVSFEKDSPSGSFLPGPFDVSLMFCYFTRVTPPANVITFKMTMKRGLTVLYEQNITFVRFGSARMPISFPNDTDL